MHIIKGLGVPIQYEGISFIAELTLRWTLKAEMRNGKVREKIENISSRSNSTSIKHKDIKTRKFWLCLKNNTYNMALYSSLLAARYSTESPHRSQFKNRYPDKLAKGPTQLDPSC